MNLLFVVCAITTIVVISAVPPSQWEMKAFSYTNDKYCPNVSFASPESDLSLYNLASTGANYISLVVTNWQDTIDTTVIYPTNRTATDEALIHAITTAHKLGLKIMFKPHVDLTSDPEHWRGQIGEDFTDEQWGEWFESYSTMLLHYANMGQQYGVEVFSLGCELIATSPRDAEWRALAAQVRKVFTGAITYSSNWGGEETNKTWWDVVDFIGVDAYYPLAPDIENPTLQDLIEYWGIIVQDGVANGVNGCYMHGGLLNLTQTYGKMLAFTETGACSGGCGNNQIDMAHQVLYMESIFGAFSNYTWFKGMHWWNWVTDPAFGGDENSCMSPQFKPAEQVFRQYYGGTYNSTRPNYPAKCPCIL